MTGTYSEMAQFHKNVSLISFANESLEYFHNSIIIEILNSYR